MLTKKVTQQLKPINRSSSETKKEQATQKPNYHFTSRRDRSDSRNNVDQMHATSDLSQNAQLRQIAKIQQDLTQSVQNTTKLPIKLPDLKIYQKQLDKSNSNGDITKREGPSIKHRLIVSDIKPSKLPPRPVKKQTPPLVTPKTEVIHQLNFASITKAGYEGQMEKTNQDREFIINPIDGKNDQGAFCVMDGHGMDGEFVSEFVKNTLKETLQKNFKVFDFVRQFQELHSKIKQQTIFGSQYSGTTLTLLLIKDNTIFCGWLGDSRAISVKKGKNNLEVKELSQDHKPNLEKERQRIESNGGLVDTYHLVSGQAVGPSRVWVKGQQYPGLAMSRSLGDQIAASVGVSQIPDITQTPLSEMFIVIASDGLWEFISNQQVAELVHPFYLKNDAQGAVEKLYAEAFSSWRRVNDGVDDITIIVIFVL